MLRLRELAQLAEASAQALPDEIAKAAGLVREVLAGGGTLFFCGNGGSAADAQHIATEYVVRYMRKRRAHAGDRAHDRHVAADGGGQRPRLRPRVRAAGRGAGPAGRPARRFTRRAETRRTSSGRPRRRAAKGAQVLAFTARDGGALRALADVAIIVPTDAHRSRAGDCTSASSTSSANWRSATPDESMFATGRASGRWSPAARAGSGPPRRGCWRAHGADVAIDYRSRQAEADAVAAELSDARAHAPRVHRASSATGRRWTRSCDGIAPAWGGLDIFVGNAGIWPSDEAAVRDMR